MILYRPGDKIPMKAGQFRLVLTPVTEAVRVQCIQEARVGSGPEAAIDNELFQRKMLRASLVEFSGLEGATFADGSPVVLEKEEGYYREEAISLIIQALGSSRANQIGANVISGDFDMRVAEGIDVEIEKDRLGELNTKKPLP